MSATTPPGRRQRAAEQQSEAIPFIGTEAAAIIERMKVAHSVSTDGELADILKTTKTTVSSWRRRGSIPLEYCILAAKSGNSSLDYLVLGDDRRGIHPAIDIKPTAIDIDLFNIAFYERTISYLKLANFSEYLLNHPAAVIMMAEDVVREYRRQQEMFIVMLGSGAATRESFLSALASSVGLGEFWITKRSPSSAAEKHGRANGRKSGETSK